MNKRKRITSEQRLIIYKKFNGHCAYCGCEIDIKDMQVDHITPMIYYDVEMAAGRDIDTIDNYMPACRSCNKYKDTLTVEDFRQRIENMHDVLTRDSVTYKNAVRFGQVIPNKHRPIFYFEKEREQE